MLHLLIAKNLTGSLEIPQGITSIKSATFKVADLTGRWYCMME